MQSPQPQKPAKLDTDLKTVFQSAGKTQNSDWLDSTRPACRLAGFAAQGAIAPTDLAGDPSIEFGAKAEANGSSGPKLRKPHTILLFKVGPPPKGVPSL